MDKKKGFDGLGGSFIGSIGNFLGYFQTPDPFLRQHI